MKKFQLTGKQKKTILIGISIITLAIVFTIALYSIGGISLNKSPSNAPEIVSTIDPDLDIEVTADELQTYRNNIGHNMDIKKSVIVIFNERSECQSFIDEYGDKDNILNLGIGIIPEMEGENGEQYFNCVGNTVFESMFDSMQDNEYLLEPVEFGGAFCYFKRIEVVSIVDDDESLKEFIRREKTLNKGGGGE